MIESDDAIYTCVECGQDMEIALWVGPNGPYCIECACLVLHVDDIFEAE